MNNLHNEAHVIHTGQHIVFYILDEMTANRYIDLQPNNILMGIDDESVFSDYEKEDLGHPVPQKIVDDRTIYLSRPLSLTFGPSVLCDLDKARFGDEEYYARRV